MKIANTNIASMYVWAIFLLSLLAAVESYFHRQIPLNLLTSVTVAAILDVILKKFYLKRGLAIPYSSMISGLIIGSIAPFNSPILLGVIASAVAILSKFLSE